MNSKLSLLLVTLMISATIIHESESVLFTLGGLWVDSNIAFVLFNKFLYIVHAIGKRDIAPPKPNNSWFKLATPDQYLAVAASIDTDKCLPLAVCVAMAKSRDVNSKRNRFEDLVIDTFQRKIKESSTGAVDRVSPLSYYVEAAKFGQTVGVAENCRLVSPTCNYTLPQLSQLALNSTQ